MYVWKSLIVCCVCVCVCVCVCAYVHAACVWRDLCVDAVDTGVCVCVCVCVCIEQCARSVLVFEHCERACCMCVSV